MAISLRCPKGYRSDFNTPVDRAGQERGGLPTRCGTTDACLTGLGPRYISKIGWSAERNSRKGDCLSLSRLHVSSLQATESRRNRSVEVMSVVADSAAFRRLTWRLIEHK